MDHYAAALSLQSQSAVWPFPFARLDIPNSPGKPHLTVVVPTFN
jgi:hypothetical protein